MRHAAEEDPVIQKLDQLGTQLQELKAELKARQAGSARRT
jgi:hypothetical protein